MINNVLKNPKKPTKVNKQDSDDDSDSSEGAGSDGSEGEHSDSGVFDQIQKLAKPKRAIKKSSSDFD